MSQNITTAATTHTVAHVTGGKIDAGISIGPVRDYANGKGQRLVHELVGERKSKAKQETGSTEAADQTQNSKQKQRCGNVN